MNKIVTLEDLEAALKKRERFQDTKITQKQVSQYGLLTKDWNTHNHQRTTHFANPAVQGSYLLGMFGGFHKERCALQGREPICMEEWFRCSFPIFVNQIFVPVLTVKTAAKEDPYIKVEWLYEIFCNDKRHFRATILYWYVLF